MKYTPNTYKIQMEIHMEIQTARGEDNFGTFYVSWSREARKTILGHVAIFPARSAEM